MPKKYFRSLLKKAVIGIYIALILLAFLPTPNFLTYQWRIYNGSRINASTEPRYVISVGSFRFLSYGAFYQSAAVLTIILGFLMVGFSLRYQLSKTNQKIFLIIYFLCALLLISIISTISALIYWLKGPWHTGSY